MGLYNTYGIYGIVNKVNGFVYVGKTVNSFGDRWDCHKAQLRKGYNGNRPLQEDWNIYGESNFEFIIIDDCTGQSLDVVNQKEIDTIAYYKQINKAYNLHDGGDNSYFLGKHLSDETKKKIGEKNRINMTGRHATQETKDKMSATHKQRFKEMTDEERRLYGEKIKQRYVEQPMSQEARDKISKAQKNNKNGAKYTPETILEIRRLFEKEHKTIKEISAQFNICSGTISGIVHYRRWADLKLES